MFGAWSNLPDVPADGVPKPTPPEATPVVLPEPLILRPARITYHKSDPLIVKHVRSKFRSAKLRHLRKEDLRKFNISSTDVLPFEELLPKEYIPPKSWLIAPRNPRDPPSEATALAFEALLSNGAKRPGHRKFLDLSKELLADLRTVYRSIRRDPAPQGEQNLRILQFRKFWIALHSVGCFWDTSLDNVAEITIDGAEGDVQTTAASTAALRDTAGGEALPATGLNTSTTAFGSNMLDEADSESGIEIPLDIVRPKFAYTGRRTSTGSQMDAILSLNLAEAFLEPLMYAFGCHYDQTSRGFLDLYLANSSAPCLNTKLIYSKPKDPVLARQGVLEGPVAVIHAHASVAFGPGTNGDVDQSIRELKAILLCAQQRSREHEQPFYPGAGEWWGLSSGKWGHTVSNGVGGLSGEAVGEPLTDLDLFPESSLPLTTLAKGSVNMPSLRPNRLQDLAMTDSIEEGDLLLDESTTLPGPSHRDSSTSPVKVFPLTGDELKSRMMESTLAAHHSDLANPEAGNGSLTDLIPAFEASPDLTTDHDLGISKKRSFETFATPSDTLQSMSGNVRDTMEMDAEAVSPLQNPSSRNIAGPLQIPTSETYGTGNYAPPAESDNQAAQNQWYKRMLESVRKGQVAEQKARKAFTERANQPARELFPETFKKSKRIGMPPTAARDEIYLISVLNHHIAFVHSTIDHKLIDWLSPNPRERARVTSLNKDTASWWGIPLKRSRWYDLFDEQDRVEALRAIWAIFGKMMADPENDLQAAMAAREQKYSTTASDAQPMQ